ncbi:MAG: hypothetical protein R3C11_21930 [Planctomycetaceae bacterium]
MINSLYAADEQRLKPVFPGQEWERRTPAELNLKPEQLREFSQFVGAGLYYSKWIPG